MLHELTCVAGEGLPCASAVHELAMCRAIVVSFVLSCTCAAQCSHQPFQPFCLLFMLLRRSCSCCKTLAVQQKCRRPLAQAHTAFVVIADREAVACSIEGMMCARLFTKGAAEQILELCTRRIRDDSGVALLGPDEKQHLLSSFSHDGNRCG